MTVVSVRAGQDDRERLTVGVGRVMTFGYITARHLAGVEAFEMTLSRFRLFRRRRKKAFPDNSITRQTTMPLHPVFEAALNAALAAGKPGLSDGTVETARRLVAEGANALGAGPDVHSTKTVNIPGRDGPIRALYYEPESPPRGLLVYFHGGGWVAGTADSFDALARTLCARSRFAVLNVDYCLAPEAPFPGGLQDAEDAIRWASANMAALASIDAPLVLGGDSAGGNLATVAARNLSNTVKIALQLLFYPVTDHNFETSSYQVWADGQSLTRADMHWFFELYAPPLAWASPRISPLRADLRSSPPAWIALAEYDVLRSEGEAYAEALRQADVRVECKIWQGTQHGFVRWFKLVDVVDLALDAAAKAMIATA